MSAEWSRLVLLAAEITFAVLFLRALLGYLRQRDPLQGDVTLVFAPCAVIFGIDLVQQWRGELPAWVNVITVSVLLAQPYLTIRLLRRLRPIPPVITHGVLSSYLLSAVPLIFAPRPIPRALLVFAVVTFLAGELIAAVLLLRRARTRTGANRARLFTAGIATLAFALMILLIGAASATGGDPQLRAVSRILALVSGVGYLIAFVPPRWLRRLFSATAAQSVTERLLRAPVDSPEQVWQTYVEIMRVQTGADAVAVLMPRGDAKLGQVAYSGPPAPTPAETDAAALARLMRPGPPVRLRDSPLSYGRDLTDAFVTVLGMPVPPDVEGAVLLINRRRNLFSDDDLRLLAELGGQAGILAERQATAAAQRELAAELRASVEALTRAGKAKSDFLANMSHELRTPLNAIIGFSDLMRLEEPEGDRRKVPADWVEHIHSSGRHLLHLINDILDMVKVESGRMELRLTPIRIDTTIEEMLTGLAPLLTEKRLTVSTDMAAATALADRVRFRQIVENLLSNAIKFTPEGGSITITATADEHDVHITVADTGVGIAPADLERVFEEFQQVGDPERQRAGTGLGLALAKRLVEAHRGEITLASEPGVGSAFTVRLPAAPVARFSAAGSEGAPRILLIEDDPQAAELMQTQLSIAGYRVEVAGTGESGLAVVHEHRPDAIVLDTMLPGIDGWEVIRRLKADQSLAGIPVFFATIVDDPQAGLSLGASDYFVKPVDQSRLLSALANAIAARPTPRVLVVDHDDVVRDAIADGLRAGGADVVACSDGRDGLARSRAENFDLIVCDMQSPEVDGFSLLAAIEQDPAGRHTPVLGLSAAALAHREGDETAPLIATAMAGGVVGDAISGGAGWENVATLLGRHPAARASALPLPAPATAGQRPPRLRAPTPPPDDPASRLRKDDT